jgi:hypothetical protein
MAGWIPSMASQWARSEGPWKKEHDIFHLHKVFINKSSKRRILMHAKSIIIQSILKKKLRLDKEVQLNAPYCTNHTLNIELDLESLFGLLCKAVPIV